MAKIKLLKFYYILLQCKHYLANMYKTIENGIIWSLWEEDGREDSGGVKNKMILLIFRSERFKGMHQVL